MSQALVAAFSYLGATAAVATVMAYTVTLVATFALSNYQRKKAERSARAQFDAAQVDRMTNVVTTVGPRMMVLGRVRTGGTVFFRGTAPPFNAYFYLCVALAAHEIDAVERIYFNDLPIDLDGFGNKHKPAIRPGQPGVERRHNRLTQWRQHHGDVQQQRHHGQPRGRLRHYA